MYVLFNQFNSKLLLNQAIIIDNSEFKKYPSDDVVTYLHNFIIAHVKSVVTSDGDDCKQKTVVEN